MRFGAVSTEVAEALASGAAARFDAAYGIGITGIAGPDGGTEEKPVGTVCFSVCGPEGARITRRTQLPGSRSDVRDRSTTVAMHLLRRLLVEASAAVPGAGGARSPGRVAPRSPRRVAPRSPRRVPGPSGRERFGAPVRRPRAGRR